MPEIKINRFLGLHTRAGRDSRPLGALDDVNNLVFNSASYKPSLRTGYYRDLNGNLTDISGDTILTSYRLPRGTFPATETPSAQNIQVVCGNDGSNTWFFQRPFWKHNDGTIDSTNWLRWGESHTTTIANGGGGTATIDLTAGESQDDYYNGWIVFNSTENSGPMYIEDYTDLNNRCTLSDDTPVAWGVGDTVILYRHFHDNRTFIPRWTDPIVLKQGNDILASGGQGSTTGYKPVWSGYVNKTFFSDSSNPVVYKGTYVTEAEIKNDGSGISPGVISSYTPASSGLYLDSNATKRFFQGFVFETDDGQRSNLITNASNYLDVGATDGVQTAVLIFFPLLNKRARYIHHFAGAVEDSTGRTSLNWDEYFFIETFDLAGTGWTYNTVSTTDYRRTIQLDGAKWNSKGEDLETFLGHTAPNRTTVSFSYGQISNGRLFVGKYYDYNAALSYNDQVNFSPFASNGVPQYNKLCDLDDQVQTSVEAGDPSVLQNVMVWDGKLFLPKNRGVYFIDITTDPTSWILETVTKEIGCDSPDSVVVTPEGIIWAKSGDGIYLWRQGDPIEISRNWRPIFRALTTTYASSWWGWYDPFYRSYRLMYTSDGSTKTTVYEGFLDVQDEKVGGLPLWTKHIIAQNLGSVSVRSDGTVFFSTNATTTYIFSSSSFQDGETTQGGADGTQIRPYLKLGSYAPSEFDLALFYRWNLSVIPTTSGTAEAARQLDLKFYVDGSAIKTYTDQTTTASRFGKDLPIVGRLGTYFDFEFNSNASKRGLGNNYQINELTVLFEPRSRGQL